MKIDRLLSIVIYLLNRDLVAARELAERFEVSVRTIQRDMEALDLAGIPVTAVQGPHGGYTILDGFKLDSRLVSIEDLYYILTALSGIDASLPEGRLTGTIEKMKGLLPGETPDPFSEKRQKLNMDFSFFGGSEKQRENYRVLEEALDRNRLVRFAYTNNRLESRDRTVEPMTLVFKWKSWYLFGYCRLKGDYRLFRLGRIRELEVLDEHFRRRSKTADEFLRESFDRRERRDLEVTLKFHPDMRSLVEEFWYRDEVESLADGSLIVKTRLEENGWVYGMILSYGSFVEVLEPEGLRRMIRDAAEKISALYR
jgi:predicted DNA-binding transcriptional regulator YafY